MSEVVAVCACEAVRVLPADAARAGLMVVPGRVLCQAG